MPAIQDSEGQKWQAENDAITLMRAEEVKADKGRLKSALKILKEQHQQREQILKDTKQA
jgi:hypothetical protein